ncbi:MAG: beta-ketoacyl synthase N-terminal-like domain-containing protein, partial [Thermoanaerobaculia bacterium]
MEKRRVVVTGIGIVSPLGIGTEATWQALKEGRSGIGRITKFDVTQFAAKIAGEVRGFDPADWLDRKEIKKSDTFIHFAVAASQMAVDDSALDFSNVDGDRAGVIIASGIGGFPLIQETHSTLLSRGPSRISPFFIPGCIVNLAAGQVSIRFGLRGPSSAPATACAAGAHA